MLLNTGDSNYNSALLLTRDNLRNYFFSDILVHKIVCGKYAVDEMLTNVNRKTGRFELNEIILSLVQKN